VFGSPKVGGTEFADMVHSLPNLRVMRVELAEAGRDVYTCLPEGSRWRHAPCNVDLMEIMEVKRFELI